MPRPGYKTNRRGRKTYRKRGTRSTVSRYIGYGRSAYNLAAKAYRGVNYVRGLVNAELFKYDVSLGPSNIASTVGNVYGLTSMAQGDGGAGRTGNSIFCRSVNVKGVLNRNASAGTVSTNIRVTLVCDNQQIGDGTPSYTDIYSTASPFSHLNANTVGRFSILHTKTYTLNNDNESVRFDFNKPMRMHTRFNGATGTDIQKCGLYLWVFSDATTDVPTVTGEARLSYHDN